MPFPDASHSIQNCLLKLGKLNIEAVVRACFSCSKARVPFSVHVKFPFFIVELEVAPTSHNFE